jgi:DNA invertase Pin-like site-specific DNA recombinase
VVKWLCGSPQCFNEPTVLGGLAEFERDLIRARTGEGRKGAKARGVKLDRKPKPTPHQQREAIHRREVDGETLPTLPAATTSAAARLPG